MMQKRRNHGIIAKMTEWWKLYPKNVVSDWGYLLNNTKNCRLLENEIKLVQLWTVYCDISNAIQYDEKVVQQAIQMRINIPKQEIDFSVGMIYSG